MRAALAGLVALVALGALPARAQAQLRTCVRVEGARAQADALARLVATELDRHSTHRAASDDCQGYLTVELLDLGAGAGAGRWVTGRINAQVPHREPVGSDGLVPAVERLITVLVANDPLALRGPESQGWLARQKRALQLRSTMRYGAELYELVAPLGGQVATLPGVALNVRREVSAFALGARLAGAFDPAGGTQLTLRTQVDAQLEVVVYARPSADVSLFASALVGLAYQRFSGPAPLDGPDATGTATTTGLSLALRAGVEALRTADVRVVGFLALQAPAFVSRDIDHGVIDRWVPAAAIGAGVLY